MKASPVGRSGTHPLSTVGLNTGHGAFSAAMLGASSASAIAAPQRTAIEYSLLIGSFSGVSLTPVRSEIRLRRRRDRHHVIAEERGVALLAGIFLEQAFHLPPTLGGGP